MGVLKTHWHVVNPFAKHIAKRTHCISAFWPVVCIQHGIKTKSSNGLGGMGFSGQPCVIPPPPLACQPPPPQFAL